MIISKRHKFIFLLNRKTAGTSVVVSLARQLGDDDLMISGIDETLNAGISLTKRMTTEAADEFGRSINLLKIFGRKIYGRAVSRSLDHRYRPLLGRKPPHAPAPKVAEAFPLEWETFQKFCVVRNPWDKTVSDYFWRIQRVRNPPSFNQYISALTAGESMGGIVPIDYHSNWDMYTINDVIAADHVIQFDDLSGGLRNTLAAIGLEWDGWLPNAKSTTRKKREISYRDLYTSTTAAQVERLYAKEIAAFDFRF